MMKTSGNKTYTIKFLKNVIEKEIPALPAKIKLMVQEAIKKRLTVDPFNLGNCTNVVVWATSAQTLVLCNLIKNVCFSVRQLPLAHQLSYKQNFWIPDWNDTICCLQK
ncbi:hypothetical protein [Wolbachia endosymbiont of Aedes albopictus]|uniref:hypothetical protein n=1 Tax=Wolbachia endosymbiont of Aedes albopictus TaxID=167957 RepID=UPI00216A53B6|nr:hypothetical protein [Wolbachia endosymbiont of Aedes albopictus]UVW83577.1 hypothetical protein NHG98_04335 [Wolbachia endosymbiont of Aedes albopictus]